MQPRAFEYVRAASMAEAVGLLAKHGEKAKILAGGQSLVPLMKLRLVAPEVVVDLNRVPGLSAIREGGGSLRIGAMVRHRELAESPLIRERYPLLADVPHVLGDPQVRNMGTIGGSLAHADPAGDWGTALIAFDASLRAVGPNGERTLPVDGFFKDPFTTALDPAEILTEIRIPVPPPHSGGAYAKLKRKTGDFAIVAVSAQVALADGGTIAAARIGVGAVGPIPFRAEKAAGSLIGKLPSDGVLREAGRLASEASEPASDFRGSAEYRRRIVALLARRALETAVARARE